MLLNLNRLLHKHTQTHAGIQRKQRVRQQVRKHMETEESTGVQKNGKCGGIN